MEDSKEMTEEILAQIAALVDGELPVFEREELEAKIAASPELVSHRAFLERLREATRSEPLIAMPPGLSERIAAATYARPTIWSRISAALSPAPARYAFTGLALSGAAAICWVALKPATFVPNAPVASPTPAAVAIADPTPAPVQPRPKAVAPTPAPIVSAPQVAFAPTPAPIELPAPTLATRVPVPDMSALPGAVPRKSGPIPPSPAPERRATGAKPAAKQKALAPAKLVDPLEGQITVADASEPEPSTASMAGEISGPSESVPVAAQPRSTTVGASGAAALRDPGDPSNVEPIPTKAPAPVETTKIKLAKSVEGLGGALSAKGALGAISGSRMSLVSDGVNR